MIGCWVSSGRRTRRSRGSGQRDRSVHSYNATIFTSLLLILPPPHDLVQASSSNSAAPSSGQSDSLALLQDYLLHSLLSNRVARDLGLIKTLLRPTTATKTAPSSTKPVTAASSADLLKVLPSVIKLYDGIIKAWESIRELGAVEADGDVSEAIEGKIGFFRAKRSVVSS